MEPKIVVALLTSTQEFQRMQAADACSAARRAGLGVEIIFAESNAIQQIHQLYRFIHTSEAERPAAIVVEPVSREGMERVARNAVKAGIAWIVQQWKADYLGALQTEHPKVPVASVAVDEDEIGRIQARQFQTLLPKGGPVLLLQGPVASATAVDRLDGLKEGLMGSGVELRRVLNADWTTDSAEAAVASWLRLRSGAEIELVGSQNDSMAAGAHNAILQLRSEWAKLPFTGCDGLPEEGLKSVASGQLTATIVKPTTTGPSVELVARMLRGQPVPKDVVLHARSHPPLEELARLR
jgi:ABC-type sugar transport system substrate-binding protein